MLLPYFQAIENGPIGEAIRDSTWLFPFIEAFHLVGLAVIGGAVLLVDFRLLGVGLKRQPVSELARDAQPWIVGGLGFMFSSGVLLFLAESVKCYYSAAFWIKMTALLLAIVFTFTVRRRITMAEDRSVSPFVMRLVGATSILLWATVGWGGRWIGFS